VRTAFTKSSEDNLTAMVVQFGWQEERGEELIKVTKQMVQIKSNTLEINSCCRGL
jgi:uncharacterized protein (DUF2249 family)